MRRILTAVLLIPLVVSLILWGHPYLLVAVELAISLLALWEFFRLADAVGAKPLRIPGYAFAVAVALLSFTDSISIGILAASALLAIVLLVVGMFPRRQLTDYLGSVSATFLGVFYVTVPLALLVWVCLQYDGPFLTLFTLVVIWVGDSAAFFIGQAFGSLKSAPRISPSKTWEGTTASFTAALLTGAVFARFFWGSDQYWEPILLAAALNVAGQVGDLAESALKRNAGVKDSSQLLPGHGGVLDRIDALLFAAPVLWYYWLWKAS